MDFDKLLKYFKIKAVQYLSEKSFSPAIYLMYENGDVERTIFSEMVDLEVHLKEKYTKSIIESRNNKLDKI